MGSVLVLVIESVTSSCCSAAHGDIFVMRKHVSLFSLSHTHQIISTFYYTNTDLDTLGAEHEVIWLPRSQGTRKNRNAFVKVPANNQGDAFAGTMDEIITATELKCEQIYQTKAWVEPED